MTDSKRGTVAGQPTRFIRGHTGAFRGLAKGEASLNSLLSGYKVDARRRGLSWDISINDFERLTSSNCHYCGAPPSAVRNNPKFNGNYIY